MPAPRHGARVRSRRRTTSSGSPPTRIALLELYDARPDFVLPRFRFNEARSFIAGGLQDFSISRAGQPWGIPLPWDESQVAYVWADALVNYLSALTYARPGEDLRADVLARRAAPDGKDILRFHCVYWPAMLLSAGYEVPKQIFVHGYLLLDDTQDLEVARERHRPARPDRRLRRRRRSLLVRPRGLVRPGRQRVDRRPPRALRARARQRPRQPPLANDGDDRALPRRRARPRTAARRARAADRRARATTSPADLDRCDITGALDRDLVARPPAQPLRQSDAPWELAKDEATAGELDAVLYDLADGLRPSRSRSRRTCRRPRRGSSRRSASRPTSRWDGVALRRSRSRPRHRAPAPPLFPRIERAAARRVIDTHAHLERATRPRCSSSARARPVSTRVITVGDDGRRCARRARARRARTTACSRASASTRTRPARRATRRASSARCSGIRRPSRSGRRASTTSATTRRTTRSSGSSSAQLALARELGKPVVIHTRAADDDTLDALAGHRRHGRPPLLLVAAAARRRRSSTAGTSRSPATSRTRTRTSCATRRGASRPTASSPRPTARTSRRSRCAAGETSRRTSCTRSTSLAELRGVDATSSRRRSTRTRRRVFGLHERSLRARALGQHFLVDENILRVIERLAELDADGRRARDRAGPRRAHALPRRARRARARRRGRPARSKQQLARDRPNVSCTGATRSTSTSAALDPPPRKLVANLPYNVATPIVAESLAGRAARAVVRDGAARGRRPLLRAPVDEGVRRRLRARTARGGADRLPPGLARGVPAAAERRLGARRVPPQSRPGSLGRGQARRRRRRSRTAGRRSRTRSRSPGSPSASGRSRRSPRSAAPPPSAPRSSSRRSSSRSRRRSGDRARTRRSTSRSSSVRCGADGKHELVTVLPGARPRRPRSTSSPPTRRPSRASTDTIVRGALAQLAGRAGWRVADREADPRRRRARRRQLRRRAALRLANGLLDRPLRAGELRGARGARRRRRALLPSPTGRSSGPATAPSSSRSTCRRTTPCSCSYRTASTSTRPPTSTRRSTRATARPGSPSVPPSLRAALAGVERPRDLAALPPNDLAGSPLAERASSRGRVPRRRQRRRSGGVRPVRKSRARGAARRRLCAGSARCGSRDLRGTVDCDVRSPRDRAWIVAHRALAPGAALPVHALDRRRREPALPRSTRSIGGRRSRSPLIAVGFWWYVARGNRSDTLREVGWIFAVSQLLVLCVPVALDRRAGDRDRRDRAPRNRCADLPVHRATQIGSALRSMGRSQAVRQRVLVPRSQVRILAPQ